MFCSCQTATSIHTESEHLSCGRGCCVSQFHLRGSSSGPWCHILRCCTHKRREIHGWRSSGQSCGGWHCSWDRWVRRIHRLHPSPQPYASELGNVRLRDAVNKLVFLLFLRACFLSPRSRDLHTWPTLVYSTPSMCTFLNPLRNLVWAPWESSALAIIPWTRMLRVSEATSARISTPLSTFPQWVYTNGFANLTYARALVHVGREGRGEREYLVWGTSGTSNNSVDFGVIVAWICGGNDYLGSRRPSISYCGVYCCNNRWS